MGTSGETWYPAVGFYFKVEVAGVTDTADNSFKEVSGLSVELGSEKLTEGGVNYTVELPTQLNASNLVLKRGVLSSKKGLMTWVEDTINSDYSSAIELKNIIVKLFNDKGSPLITWTFNDARPVKYQVSELESSKSEVLVETMEFTYTFYTKTYAS